MKPSHGSGDTATPPVSLAPILFWAGFFLLWSLRATVLFPLDQAIASPDVRAAYGFLVKALLWAVPAFVFVRVYRRAEPFFYLGFYPAPSRRGWTLSLVISAIFLGAILISETLLGPKHLAWPASPPSVAGLLLGWLGHPLLEEILFRGLLQKELSRRLAPAGAIALTSLLFAAIHLPYWLVYEGFTAAVLTKAVSVFFFSVVVGVVFHLSKSLWPATLLHIANNALAACLMA